MASNRNLPSPYCLLLVLHVLVTQPVISSAGAFEAETLIKFKESLSNHTALDNWNASVLMCNGNTPIWNGLLCTKNGTFYGLQLEAMGLRGLIDLDTLAALPYLRSVSFMNNDFDGPVPDVKKLGSLRRFYLSNNRFSGEIPDDAFAGMKSITTVHLANNEFTGKIPTSLAKLLKLFNLQLQNNQFEGKIPDFMQKDLVANLANNKLEGRIPTALSNEDESSFVGNINLCGQPLNSCKSSKNSVPKVAIIVVVAGIVVLAAIIVASFVLRVSKRKRKSQFRVQSVAKFNKKDFTYKSDSKEVGLAEHEEQDKYKNSEHGKLYFVSSEGERFELQDLLRACAEVLGSGNFGSSYKAVLLSGPAMVVKRFRQMSNVGTEEFQEYMISLGRLSHRNLLPLVAFYYRKEEKLLISDFVENGSLASHLHGKRNPQQPGIDWPTRIKIIKGVAKGLAYLYKELPNQTLPHGHLKSSNVLLDNTFEPLLADYALVPVINREHAQQFMVAYKSPEFTQHRRTTKKTDVWSLGILILETLTGKFPANYLKQGKEGANADLAAWVNSVVREEWTGEVFDKDMKGTKNGEGEMLKLLKIGMCCCDWNVERRWDLKEAVEKIEELKDRDSDEEYSSFASEGDFYSSRPMTEDEFSFSVTG